MRSPTILASLVLGGAAVIAGSVHGAEAEARFMKLGGTAAAPPGFLAFCARLPDQCGLADAKGSDGRPVDVVQRGHDLYTKYYWPALFAQGAAPPADLSPTARLIGGGATRVSDAASGGPNASWTEAARGISPLTADSDLMRELDRVNLRVNRTIRYVSDKALYGDEDYWHFALGPGEPAAGDCKDYVLEKRRALIADGVKAADLSIAIVETGWRESHAVLLVSTDRGELVLDSLSDWVRPWWQVRYTWIERQAPGRQLEWVSIG